jgi:hypothetical protein
MNEGEKREESLLQMAGCEKQLKAGRRCKQGDTGMKGIGR